MVRGDSMSWLGIGVVLILGRGGTSIFLSIVVVCCTGTIPLDRSFKNGNLLCSAYGFHGSLGFEMAEDFLFLLQNSVKCCHIE